MINLKGRKLCPLNDISNRSMPYTYPPTSTIDFSIHLLTYEQNTPYAYVSTPMTSGLTHLTFKYATGDVLPEDKSAIWNLNLAQANFLERCIQKLNHGIKTVNPFTFQCIGERNNWIGNDYLVFWREVIVEKCKSIHFVDNWEFSQGCAYEFLNAKLHNISTYDSDGRLITTESGLNKISNAIADYQMIYNECTLFLCAVHNDLMKHYQATQTILNTCSRGA